jgi:uncharacterized membrane protein
MGKILANLRSTVLLSAVLALVFLVGYGMHYARGNGGHLDVTYWQAVLRFLHVLAGIMWVGLLYYFNFVQIPQMAVIPAEQKPAVTKFIAPAALFWFRWSALATWVLGVALAVSRGYFLGAVTLGASDGFHVPQHTFIGVGMWLATIMFLNVWGIIWPNQKRALGIIDVDADKKAKAGRTAMLASRVNVLLSIPMLTTMAMNQTIFG